ncbi:MAG: rod shape-determining protein MreD [Fidelibacterota bacterium]
MSSNIRNTIIFGFITFLLQLLLSEWMSIQGIRPDFVAIFIVYMALTWGSFYAVWVGFFLGILVDLLGAGDTFGISSIFYVIIGYFTGYVPRRTHNFPPIYFHLGWILAFFIAVLINAWFQYPILFATSKWSFLSKSLFIASYTLGFIGLIQFIIPLRRRSD